jgi:hypothetical protein
MKHFFSLRSLSLLSLVTLTLAISADDASAQRRAATRRATSSAPAATEATTSAPAASSAASSATGEISYGGMLGTTYMMYSGPAFNMTGFGYHLGAVVDVPVASHTGVIARVGYESKKAMARFTEGNARVDVGFTLNYIELAGAVRYDVSPSLMLEGGMALQLGVSGNATVYATDGQQSAARDIDGELAVPTQLAITAGTGYRVKVGPNTEIIPHASVNLFLTSPGTNDASAHTIRVGTRVMFN